MRGGRGQDIGDAPKACVLCGTPYGLSRQEFRLGGRAVDLPVCQVCWKRHETSRVVLLIAVAVGALAIAGGVVLSVVAGGVAPGLVGVAIACARAGPAV